MMQKTITNHAGETAKLRGPGPYCAVPASGGDGANGFWYVAGEDKKRNILSLGSGRVFANQSVAVAIAGTGNRMDKEGLSEIDLRTARP